MFKIYLYRKALLTHTLKSDNQKQEKKCHLCHLFAFVNKATQYKP